MPTKTETPIAVTLTGERNARAIHDAREHVAAEFIGAQPMRKARRLGCDGRSPS